MKIVSKDTVTGKTPQKPAQNQKVQSQSKSQTEPKPKSQGVRQASKPKSTKNNSNSREIQAKRRAHIENQKQKRKAPPQQNEEISDFQKAYNNFISLIRFNITFKLTVGYSMRLIALILFIIIGSYSAFSYFLYYQAEQTLIKQEAHVLTLLNDPVDRSNTRLTAYLDQMGLSLHLFDAQQVRRFTNSDTPLNYHAALQKENYNLFNFPKYPALVRYGTLTDGHAKGKYYVIKKTLEDAEIALEASLPVVIVLTIALLLSAVRSSSRLAQKHLKPIHTITEQVKDMSANNLSTRLNVSGTKDELKDLAITFNSMLDDIQQSYEREKQFVSDASHELRTPIAVIKGYGGMLKRWGKDDPNVLAESIDAIVGETDNMQSLVESLLFIARNDKGALQMDKQDFNLSHLIEEIVKETHLIDTNHAFEHAIASQMVFYGSCEKLKQAIRIFMDNSIKYTPDGGKISIRLEKINTTAVLTISDNGIGISKEDLPHIFDRFYRADKSRTKMKENQHGGTGLGLSIAKIIIEQHGGKIKVSSALNEGTEFKITLPLQSL